MSVGDCLNVTCATPLDFENLLINLFGVDDNGCVGLKIVGNLDMCANLTDAATCGTDLSLQQIIENSIVDDGNGGIALNAFLMGDIVTCVQDCGTPIDLETLLKSLFAVGDTGCYGIRLYQAGLSCETLEPYTTCSASLTVEQIVKSALWHDACDNHALVVYFPNWTECGQLDCGVNLSLEDLISELFWKSTTGQCGALKVNWGLVPDDVDNIVDISECGKFQTFEEVLKRAVTEGDCGYALNIFSMSGTGSRPLM